MKDAWTMDIFGPFGQSECAADGCCSPTLQCTEEMKELKINCGWW